VRSVTRVRLREWARTSKAVVGIDDGNDIVMVGVEEIDMLERATASQSHGTTNNEVQIEGSGHYPLKRGSRALTGGMDNHDSLAVSGVVWYSSVKPKLAAGVVEGRLEADKFCTYRVGGYAGNGSQIGHDGAEAASM
jgi:hypothetical protein